MTDTHHLFSDGYIEAALWAERPDGDEGEAWDCATLAPQTHEALLSDAVNFWNANRDAIADYPDGEAQAGRDFWFTRRGHGVGYWEHADSASQALDKAAQAAGDCELYVGDDGLIYMFGREGA